MKKLLILFFTLITIQSIAQQKDDKWLYKTVNVSGSAEMEVVPDEIFVQVDLREYDKKGGGKTDIETIRNNFLNAVKSIGVTEENISVQSYSGYDNRWWYKKNKSKNPDMKASISYLIKLSSTGKMDELVTKLDDEATQNFFIQRTSHSKIYEFRKQLKIQAIKNAKDKANYLAEAIGEKIGAAITINEPNEFSFQPRYANDLSANTMMRGNSFGEAGEPQAAPMNVDFKKIKLKFDVQAVFSLQ